MMVRPITKEEIKDAMYNIGENKASGPNGYTSTFFKSSWHIIGDDVVKAVQEFFLKGKLLREVNSKNHFPDPKGSHSVKNH